MGTMVLIVVMVAAVAVFIGIYSKRNMQEYDERQLQYRGKAFMYGFFTTFVLCMLFGLLTTLVDSTKDYAPFLLLVAAFGGTFVFAAYAIWMDAFSTTAENIKRYMILLMLLLIMDSSNLLAFREGPMTKESLIHTADGTTLISLILFGAIELVLVAKMIRDKREGEEA